MKGELVYFNLKSKLVYFNWAIKAVREKLGLSRENFARLLDVTSITIFRWENGISSPRGLAKRNLHKFMQSKKVQQLVIPMMVDNGVCVGGFVGIEKGANGELNDIV